MKLTVRETVLFGMWGALMYLSKAVMEFLPNIHLVGVLIVATTVVYRQKALYPLYTFVILCGLMGGFSTWWIPYLYVWTVLWGMVMLLPRNIPRKLCPVVYIAVCGLHGFLFGTLYAPAQALLFGLNWQGTWAWIVAGIPADITHGVGNMVGGLLICPLILLLRRLEKQTTM